MSEIEWGELSPPIPKTDQESGANHPFSHLQWYLHHSKNTVYLAAESEHELSSDDLTHIANLFMTLAPQLNYRADRGKDRHVLVGVGPKAICHHATTNNLGKSIVETIQKYGTIYLDPALPNFRAYSFSLPKPDKHGIRSAYVCFSSHALMEGSESARIMRLEPSVHHASQLPAKLGALKRMTIAAAGLVLAPLHLLAATFNRKSVQGGKWVIIDIDRKAIKRLANQFGVRQRSVLFSLPLFGLHLAANLPHPSAKKKQLVSYSTLPDARTNLEDSALNLRMQVGNIATANDYETYLHQVDQTLDRENVTEVYSQAFYNSILGMHRVLQKLFPFFYGQRFFTYIPYDFVLSLLPPHITRGVFRKVFNRSIFCGSYTPGVNNCVFVPYRNGVSMNLYLTPPVLDNVDAFVEFVAELGIECRVMS